MRVLHAVHSALCGGGVGTTVPTLSVVDGGRDVSEWASEAGVVAGDPDGSALYGIADRIWAAGGNAVDATVATAMVSWLTSPQMCGAGGYGGHMLIATPGKRITTIDFNTLSPSGAQPPDALEEHGWRSSGVPGTLAGLGLAVERYGQLSLAEVVRPAVELGRRGVTVTAAFARSSASMADVLRRDPASAALLLRSSGEPWQMGDTFTNPDLAALLEHLGAEGSTDSFYRGAFGQQVARAFQDNGGRVTEADMQAYYAQEVPPLRVQYGEYEVAGPPPSCPAVTPMQVLAICRELGWERLPAGPERTHAKVEAFRLAWRDRFDHVADPEHVDGVNSKVEQLLSADYAASLASEVRAAVAAKAAIDTGVEADPQTGTLHFSATDRTGTVVSVTLTHGGTFGACVTVPGLGLTLGHGMTRFDPGTPNAIGQRKRPVHNMTPTIVCKNGVPVAAVGGQGGRKIPNGVADCLLGYVADELSLVDALRAPRLHTIGDLRLQVEGSTEEIAWLREAGFEVSEAPGFARISAAQYDPATRVCTGASA